MEGIEPSWPAWKAGTLPLSYTRDDEGIFITVPVIGQPDGNEITETSLRRGCGLRLDPSASQGVTELPGGIDIQG